MKKNDRVSSVRQVPLGRIVNVHGLRGELRLLPHAPPCPTLRRGIEVSLHKDSGPAGRYTVEAARPHGRFLLLKLQGVDSRVQAQAWRDAVVTVEEAWLPPLHEGEFYYYQVEGLRVVTTAGDCIGTITASFFSGGHDVWVVRQGEKEYLVPVIDEVVRSLDLSGGQVIIEPIPGLLE